MNNSRVAKYIIKLRFFCFVFHLLLTSIFLDDFTHLTHVEKEIIILIQINI